MRCACCWAEKVPLMECQTCKVVVCWNCLSSHAAVHPLVRRVNPLRVCFEGPSFMRLENRPQVKG